MHKTHQFLNFKLNEKSLEHDGLRLHDEKLKLEAISPFPANLFANFPAKKFFIFLIDRMALRKTNKKKKKKQKHLIDARFQQQRDARENNFLSSSNNREN